MLPRIFRATESETRRRQIDTLKVFNANVTEIQEDKEYQVLFFYNGNEFVLHISLSKEFPNDKPKLMVSPLILHPWVNADAEVTSAPGLLNFTVHSDLGRVVQAVIAEFIRSKPPLASDTLASNASPSIPIRENEALGRLSPNYYQNFSPPVQTHSYQLITFPELSSMSVDELQFMNESVERREEFLDDLSQSKEINKTLDDLMSQIEELADSNLNKRSQLEDLRKDIDTRIEEVTKLVFETERLNMTFLNLADKYSPKNIKNQLLSAAEEENAASERIAEDFLEGKIDVEQFVLDYVKKRTLAQTRKTKEEKLTQQLQNLERAGF